jgi:hypothetical protein
MSVLDDPTAFGGPGAPARGAPIRLDAGQYNVVWRHCVGGEKHLLLATLDHGRTPDERAALDAAAWRRLGGAGLADGRGVRPVLADAVALLARPDREVDVCLRSREGSRVTVACGGPGAALVAGLDEASGLWIVPVEPDDLPGALLRWVPETTPLPGIPIEVPVDALRTPVGAARGPAGWGPQLRRAGLPRPTVERLVALGSTPALRHLQFGVARRDGHGRWRRGDTVLNVLDTSHGRALWQRAGDRLLIRPVDRAWLRTELHGLLAAVPTR